MTLRLQIKVSAETNSLCSEILKRLWQLSEGIREKEISISFSGGLDSSILAFLFSRKRDPILCSVGVKGSKDLENSREAKEKLEEVLGKKLRYVEIELKKEMVLEALKEMKNLGVPDILTASFEIPLYFVLKECEAKTVISGQGADELFLGYAKYLKNPERWEEDLKRLLSSVVPFEERMAERFGKKIVRPYLDEKVIELASRIPISERIVKGIRKVPLRIIADSLGLPLEIVKREKKAAQYGSGASKLLREISKELGVGLKEMLEVI